MALQMDDVFFQVNAVHKIYLGERGLQYHG
jgi:hypothetical protein